MAVVDKWLRILLLNFVGLTRKFSLNWYSGDNSVEMYDIANKKMFLKKTVCDTVEKKDLYIGNTITVFSRMLKITGFGDEVSSFYT